MSTTDEKLWEFAMPPESAYARARMRQPNVGQWFMITDQLAKDREDGLREATGFLLAAVAVPDPACKGTGKLPNGSDCPGEHCEKGYIWRTVTRDDTVQEFSSWMGPTIAGMFRGVTHFMGLDAIGENTPFDEVSKGS
jgi:hypothetical protein